MSTRPIYFRDQRMPTHEQPLIPPFMNFGGPQRDSEENQRATPRASLVSEGVRELARRMILEAWHDLYQRDGIRTSWTQSAGFRSDRCTARDWLLDDAETPRGHFPFRLCCYALGADVDAVRARVLTTKPRKSRAGVEAA